MGKLDKIRYTIQPEGNVLLPRADPDGCGLALDSLLTFLANDIKANPQRLKAVKPELVSRIQSVAGEIEVDLDATLDPEDE